MLGKVGGLYHQRVGPITEVDLVPQKCSDVKVAISLHKAGALEPERAETAAAPSPRPYPRRRERTFTSRIKRWLTTDNSPPTSTAQTTTSSLEFFSDTPPNSSVGSHAAGENPWNDIVVVGQSSSNFQLEESESHLESVFHVSGEVLATFRCTAWRQSVPHRGELHVTAEYLAFDAKPHLTSALLVPWACVEAVDRHVTPTQFLQHWYPSCEKIPDINLCIYVKDAPPFYLYKFDSEEALVQCYSILTAQDLPRTVDVPVPKYRCGDDLEPINQFTSLPERPGDQSSAFSHALPVEEILDGDCQAVRNLRHLGVGTLYLSSQCLCFTSSSESMEWLAITLPLVDVLHLRQEARGAAIYVTSTQNELLFFPRTHNQQYQRIREAWRQVQAHQVRDLHEYWGMEPFSLRRQLESRKRQFLIAKEVPEPNGEIARWEQFLDEFGGGLYTPQWVDSVQMGVAHRFRGYCWQVSSGSLLRMKMYGGREIDRLLRLVQDDTAESSTQEDIEKDLHRSLPGQPHFMQGSVGIQELRRVLCAYACRNPAIGYCQSMNILCAVFLLFMSEEEVFWLLTVIAERLLPGYYTADLTGLMTDQRILSLLIEENLPGLVEHLEELGLSTTIITMPWFLCLFVGFLPWDTSLQILDRFFLHGPCVLFRTALSVLYCQRERIMKQRDLIGLVSLAKLIQIPSDRLFQVMDQQFAHVDMELIRAHRLQQWPRMLKDGERYRSGGEDPELDANLLFSSDGEPHAGGFSSSMIPEEYVPGHAPRDRERDGGAIKHMGLHRIFLAEQKLQSTPLGQLSSSLTHLLPRSSFKQGAPFHQWHQVLGAPRSSSFSYNPAEFLAQMNAGSGSTVDRFEQPSRSEVIFTSSDHANSSVREESPTSLHESLSGWS